MAAAQAQHCCATDSGGGCGESASDSDALAVASAVSLCLLHDLVGVALFLASHPLHAVYLLIFARGLVSLAAFFWPLLASTSLLLAVLATVGPYVGGAEWHGVRSLGRTCGIAVAALCAEHGPDGAGAGMVGQICSFVLGPTDAASVLRVEEIMGEPCDITACCFLLEEEKSLSLLGGNEREEPAFALPLMGGVISNRRFMGYEDLCDLKDGVDEKVVISEDLKGSVCLDQQCCPSVTVFVQETDAEEEENDIQRQCLILLAIEFSDDVEKRLECDPVSVEIKKSQPAQVSEIKKLELVEPMEAKKLDSVQAVQMKKSEPVESMKIEKSDLVESVETNNSKLVQELEVKNFEPVEPLEIRKSGPIEPVEIKNRERVKPPSLIAQRIKLWEDQASGNIKPVFEDKEEYSVEFNCQKELIRDVKNSVRFEAAPCIEKYNSEHQPQEVACNEESTKEQPEQEFKDLNEHTRSETEISSEKCSQNNEAEQIAVTAAKADEELQQGYKDEQPEPDLQQQAHLIKQAEQELQEMEVYTDVTSSPSTWIESPLKSTSIAGRVHSRNSSENLVSVGSPSQKDKEWKRTLACKLYEERMQIRLCRDRAVVEGSDNMDMLWEAYEVGSGGSRGRDGKRSGSKDKGGANKVEELVNEGLEEEEGDDDEEEGSVRQLCCLQALKFSTRKMNFGGGKPSLSKISKVLRRMTALSRMGSRRKQSE
ncbi:hypothetical protein HU200_064301 [Digitaria exilis]|uniref:Uncharacterized protein n=1 Tax=Digitaria exilis TaxID=1010633 RepID=A0A835A5T3_9POAL|nr:hypothetical protein HU200_064301 [Digitaria exilis]